MFKKRLYAYIIDILILDFIVSFISYFIVDLDSINNLNVMLKDITTNYVTGSIDYSIYIREYANINYSIGRALFLYNLINVFVSICYFVVYPLYNNGQTIGKKILAIRIVSLDHDIVSTDSLLLRYLLIDSIGVTMILLCSVLIFKDTGYLVVTKIFSFLQFLVVIISVFMILYRRDKRSLPDLVAGTKVIEVEK